MLISRGRQIRLFAAACALAILTMFGFALATRYARQTAKPVGQGIFARPPLWIFEAPEEIVTTPVIDPSGNVLVRTTDALYSVQGDTGTLQWRMDVADVTKSAAPPVLLGDLLVVPGSGDSALYVYAYSQSSPELLWSDCPRCDIPGDALIHYVQSVAASEGKFFVTRNRLHLTAYDAASGDVLWQQDFPGRESAKVQVENGIVYTAYGGRFIAYDSASGQELWGINVGDFAGQFQVHGTTAYVITRDVNSTKLVSIDLATRNILWEIPVESDLATAYTAVDYGSGRVIVRGNTLWAWNATTGQLLWEFSAADSLEQPVITDRAIYIRERSHSLFLFGGKDRGLYALNPATGEEIGFVSLLNLTPEEVHAGLNAAAADHLIVVPVGDNFLYAYRDQ
jgi:outer membrane protein assembly factor BamB